MSAGEMTLAINMTKTQRHQFTAIEIVQCTNHDAQRKRERANKKIGATKATTQEINAVNAN